MLMQVAAQANPGSSVRMPQVLPVDARKKMKELVLTLFTFEPKHTELGHLPVVVRPHF
jgi:hypothetical protein